MRKRFLVISVFFVSTFLGACGGSSGSNSGSDGGSSSTTSSSSSSSSSNSSSSSTSSSSSSSSASSSSSSSSSSSGGSNTTKGVFVDSAVGGIGYRTETQEGVTNDDGEYDYVAGETVTFFIGNLEFPPVEAKGVVTPLDMAASDETDNQIVVNIARLLQSLDTDGDASNGISISSSAAEAAVEVNFDVSTEEFAANSAVVNLVANSGSSTTELISAESAESHLQETIDDTRASAIGSWYYQDVSSSVVVEQYHILLTILDEDTYLIINDEENADQWGMDGFELGSYDWNVRSQAFNVEVTQDLNGEWGFSHPCDDTEVITLDVHTEYLEVGIDEEVGSTCDEEAEEGGEKIRFDRVPSEVNGLLGSWVLELEGENELAMVTFIDNTNFMMVQNSTADEDGMPGIERGTYTWDAETKEVVFTHLVDTNGQWGFSHPCAVLDGEGLSCGVDGQDIVQTLTVVEGNTLIFVSEADTIAEGEESPVFFSRLQ